MTVEVRLSIETAGRKFEGSGKPIMQHLFRAALLALGLLTAPAYAAPIEINDGTHTITLPDVP